MLVDLGRPKSSIFGTLLAQEHQACDLFYVPAQIGLIKKAILAGSFRVVQGTNDPDEKHVNELLKEVYTQ